MAKTIKLGQLIRKTHIKFCDFDGDKNLEVLGVSNIEGITRTTHKKSADLSNYLVIKPNSFAYNPYRINVGSIGLTPSAITGIVSPAYIVFQVDEEKLIPEVLLDFLKSDEGLRQINHLARGTVRKALRYDDLGEIDFPNLSLAEQEQLVRRKAKLNTNREILLSEISHQKILLAKLKQAILQEAIQGKLTADWRKENPDVESASQLLERIQQEKQRLIAEKKIRKEKPQPPITPEEIPFEIPDSWAWCRLGDLCEKTGSGSTPRGGKTAYVSSGIPFLRSQNIHNDGVVLNGLVYIPESTHTRMSGTVVYPRDVLLNITGGSIGRSAIVHDEFDEANINQHVSIIRPVERDMGQFVHKVLISSYFQNMIVEVQTGAGREGLPKNKMDRILIPTPSLDEQTAIIERVEALMDLCRQLETEIKHARTNAENLLQAVLKEAFTSKTV